MEYNHLQCVKDLQLLVWFKIAINDFLICVLVSCNIGSGHW